VKQVDLADKLALHLKRLNKKVTITNSAHDQEKQTELKLNMIVRDFFEKKYGQLIKLGAI
jgi:hypothetical protein